MASGRDCSGLIGEKVVRRGREWQKRMRAKELTWEWSIETKWGRKEGRKEGKSSGRGKKIGSEREEPHSYAPLKKRKTHTETDTDK
jgi:hypothetical protein